MRHVIEHLDAAWNALTAEGQQFAMIDTEVDGVPMRLYASAPPHMGLIWQLAAGYGDRPYLVYEDETYTYAEVDARVRALAHALHDTYGVGPGDRVAIAMRNYPEWVIAYWATVLTGAAVVGMNAWWTAREMAYGLTDSQPVVLIADDERLARVAEVLDEVTAERELSIIAVRSDDALPAGAVRWDDVVDHEHAPDGYPEVSIEPDDDATIFYTSGTTGFPKGAQLTHRGSVHNLLDMGFMPLVSATAQAMSQPSDDAAEAGGDGPPVAIAPTPMFHVTACNCIMHPITAVGGKLVFMYKWETARAIELIERERATVFSGVPTMSREMLAHPDWQTRDTSTLTGLGGGGAPLQPDLVDKIDKSLTNKRATPSVGYGLTETHGIVTANSQSFYTSRPESVGRAVPVADVKLIDETGADLPVGPDSVGELCVRGPIVIKGYLNKPEATADAIRDGWFRTGDIARIDDDGFIYIVDRAKDMVLRGGENVYCSEVETAMYEHPAIAEAAVFGVPDERLGEAVAAAIVLAPGVEMSTDDLRSFLADRIATHKIPSRVWFRNDALPRNANGKFLKRELRDELLGDSSIG